ncbi:hypothetical protein Cni_G05376 [Canna indica]|uniref:Uncharacterized protein n=1 Tax=Canna indica TaxID=4628 RepID=A0AAQ3Q5G0_9LILI|nr:hypothetical protein Cni_G05376 [Canna indica]
MVLHNNGDARLISSSSRRDVFYCCGRCGYELNLSSSNRNTANIGAEYGKAIKKGIVSFVAIDESRFTQADDLRCLPYFRSRHSWGLRRRRTRLLCRRCGCLIGVATYGESSSASSPSDGSSETNYPDTSSFRKYKIKIGALQPATDESASCSALLPILDSGLGLREHKETYAHGVGNTFLRS